MKLDLRKELLPNDKLGNFGNDGGETIKFNPKISSGFIGLKSEPAKFDLSNGFFNSHDERIKEALIKGIEERFYPGSGGLFARSDIEATCVVNGKPVQGKSAIILAIRREYDRGELQILWRWREVVKIGILTGAFETVVGYNHSISNKKDNGYFFLFPEEVPLMRFTCINGLARVCSEIGIPEPTV